MAALSKEKARREERIAATGEQIMALWKRLATPEEEQNAFLEAHAGLGNDVIAAVSAHDVCNCERHCVMSRLPGHMDVARSGPLHMPLNVGRPQHNSYTALDYRTSLFLRSPCSASATLRPSARSSA